MLGSWVVTGLVRHRAPLDHPTDRSSHTVPTPRGGGIGLVLVTLAGTTWGLASGRIDHGFGMALLGGGAMVAAVGWWDDRRGLSARARLLVHAVAAIWGLAWLGGYPALSIGESSLRLGPVGSVLAALAIVWAINLYNFMDGIDGIAGVESVSVTVGGALLLARAGAPEALLVPLLLAGSSLGFLVWNWAPARVFMGDVGSGFLGYAIAICALGSENRAGVSALYWAGLSAVFVLDATATLIRRRARGARVAEAHRSHAYQRLVRAGWSHARVSGSVLLLNLALIVASWLAPLPALGVALVLSGGAYLLVERTRPM
jgi:Fuc2NAc and GlcNAc transferase